MKRWVAAAVFCGGTVLGAFSMASAEPADQSPIGGDHAHPHHVHTGDGGCRDIDRNYFEPDPEGRHRGLHRGAVEGEVHHGPCVGGQH